MQAPWTDSAEAEEPAASTPKGQAAEAEGPAAQFKCQLLLRIAINL